MSARTQSYDALPLMTLTTLNDSVTYCLKHDRESDAIKYVTAMVGLYNERMSTEDKNLCAIGCRNLCNALIPKEMFVDAFRFCLIGIHMCEANGFQRTLADLYLVAGSIHNNFNDKEMALRCYTKALELSRQTDYDGSELTALISLAGVYAYMGRMEEAGKCRREMIEKGGNDIYAIYFSHLTAGYIHETSGENSMAREDFVHAIAYAQENGMLPKYIVSAYTALAKNYAKVSMRDSAIHCYELSNAYCREHGVLSTQKTNMKALIDLYTETGNLAQANAMRQDYALLQDSLLNIDEYTTFKNQQFEYELDKQCEKIMTLTETAEIRNLKLRQQKRITAVVAVGMLALALLCFFIYRKNKETKEAYHSLYLHNLELLRQYEEQQQLKEQYETVTKQCHDHDANTAVPDTGTAEQEASPAADRDATMQTSSTYKMSDDQRNALLEAINDVMKDCDNFCKSEFSLDRLANMVNSNSHYVSEVINETFGKNFRTYINEFRIREASHRLLNSKDYGNYTIKAIGESVGFKSHANFTDTFRKFTGMTPSLFMKMAREEEKAQDRNGTVS